MLSELHIRQFVLAEEIHLELSAGMTVFTGETGAGKSILVDALGAVFGRRTSADQVRHGAQRAEISACLDVSNEQVNAWLEAQDIEPDECLLLRRTIRADGRSRAWVNGVPVPLKLLQALGSLCLDLHGQHEHQQLMQSAYQRSLLDARLDARLLRRVSEAWRAARQARRSWEEWRKGIDEGRRQERWLRQQLEELDSLELRPGLLESLERQVDGARRVETLRQKAAQALQIVDEGEPSLYALLAQALRLLDDVQRLHPALEQAHEGLQRIDALLAELPPRLREVVELEIDEQQSLEDEARLNRLQALLQRHACADESALLRLQRHWREQLDALDTAEWDEERLRQACEQAEEDYRVAARALHEARTQQAHALVQALRPALDRLALEGMRVRIEVEADEARESWREDGWDTVRFLLSSNPGEPFRSLRQIASGGELSRLVLAMKACGVAAGEPGIAVFDEVDVGIGGETAWSVAELLRGMARERQVLVISHLPQVAALADHHVCIRKESDGQRTRSLLQVLDEDARLRELARMLGDGSEQGLRQARAMWQRGR